MGNMILDLVDFKDRVRPMSRDISMLEHSRKYQKQDLNQWTFDREQFD